MDEWTRLEASSQLTCLPQCAGCANPQAKFRCIDCFAESLFCQECLLSSHRREPFHRLQVCRVCLHSFTRSLTFLALDWDPFRGSFIERSRGRLPPWPQLRKFLPNTLFSRSPHGVRHHWCPHNHHYLLRVQVGKFRNPTTCPVASFSVVSCHLATTEYCLYIPFAQPNTQTSVNLQS